MAALKTTPLLPEDEVGGGEQRVRRRPTIPSPSLTKEGSYFPWFLGACQLTGVSDCSPAPVFASNNGTQRGSGRITRLIPISGLLNGFGAFFDHLSEARGDGVPDQHIDKAHCAARAGDLFDHTHSGQRLWLRLLGKCVAG